jgi:hypothetical protein
LSVVDIMRKLTSQEALSEAILAAQSHPETSMLSEARFGEYSESADDSGWYWELEFLTRIGKDGLEAGDAFPVRIQKVINAWTAYAEKRAAQGPAVSPEVAWSGNGCPDGGACHHVCTSGCFRVRKCGPISGVYENDEWPPEIVLAHKKNGDGPA